MERTTRAARGVATFWSFEPARRPALTGPVVVGVGGLWSMRQTVDAERCRPTRARISASFRRPKNGEWGLELTENDAHVIRKAVHRNGCGQQCFGAVLTQLSCPSGNGAGTEGEDACSPGGIPAGACAKRENGQAFGRGVVRALVRRNGLDSGAENACNFLIDGAVFGAPGHQCGERGARVEAVFKARTDLKDGRAEGGLNQDKAVVRMLVPARRKSHGGNAGPACGP